MVSIYILTRMQDEHCIQHSNVPRLSGRVSTKAVYLALFAIQGHAAISGLSTFPFPFQPFLKVWAGLLIPLHASRLQGIWSLAAFSIMFIVMTIRLHQRRISSTWNAHVSFRQPRSALW